MVELCPIAIANTDARHSVRHCNPAFDDLFRYHTGEALGRKLEIVAGLDDEVAAALRRAHGKPVNLTTRARRSDGTPIDLDVSFKRRLRASRQVFAPYRSMWRYRR